MNLHFIAEKIIALKDADEALRDELIKEGKLSDGYNHDMEQLHISNAQELQKIMDSIGYPTIDKVGQEASSAAWLIIQHAISIPAFMKSCANLLEQAVQENKAKPQELAYLNDRIAVFEGRAQRYGTQFDWDEHGAMNPKQMDDIEQVNQRRKELGLNTMAEQIHIIRKQVEEERQKPPHDSVQRKEVYDQWRKKVGWTT